jgi:hypothetical protein
VAFAGVYIWALTPTPLESPPAPTRSWGSSLMSANRRLTEPREIGPRSPAGSEQEGARVDTAGRFIEADISTLHRAPDRIPLSPLGATATLARPPAGAPPVASGPRDVVCALGRWPGATGTGSHLMALTPSSTPPLTACGGRT